LNCLKGTGTLSSEMKTRGAKACRLVLLVSLMLWCIVPGVQARQKELHWDALDVDARLNADGVLDVTERHTMVFNGDWNGGERVFNVRPRQKLEFLSLERVDVKNGSLKQLRESAVPSNVDEFTWTDSRTLRWRSRLPSDPPFANTRLTYVLHYKLSGIVLKDDAQYRIDHDFAFSNRPGAIAAFSLRLNLDPVWEPVGEKRDRYDSGPLAPGQSFVLTIPLRYSGTGTPTAIDGSRPPEIDGSRPPEIVGAVAAILVGFALIVLGFMTRERSLGRFARVDSFEVDSAWIEKNILVYPAEVVGAAWDGRIGTSEVVALIARMTAEGKLESEVDGKDSMTLRLKVDRNTLDGHERALVDGLFFDHRTETSTTAVQRHYKSSGFNPASVITPDLNKHVKKVLPSGDVRVGRLAGIALFLTGAVLLARTVYSEPVMAGGAIAAVVALMILVSLLQIPGWLFKSRMDWGEVAAALLMIPALFVSLGTAAFLWLVVGTGKVELPLTMIGAVTAWALCLSNSSINRMKSRQSRDAIAFRKRLAAGRNFFQKELEKPRPKLRDNWYPWLLAFGLGKQIDVWSSHHPTTTSNSSTWNQSTTHTASSSSSSASSTQTGWSGGGGLSGGAGATGAWAAAAVGMAAGVAAPSSSSSSGGGSSSSSSGGSSGGGGGGGW
jgi:uncharacterized membrane protein YgcG